MRQLKFTVICGCLLLTACGENEAEAQKVVSANLKSADNEAEVKDAILADLKDPDSAKFGKLTLVNQNLACMTVNAKNSMGGYTGNQQAFLKREQGKWEFITAEEVSHERCIQYWHGTEIKTSSVLGVTGAGLGFGAEQEALGPQVPLGTLPIAE